jgi:hypothetical protein
LTYNTAKISNFFEPALEGFRKAVELQFVMELYIIKYSMLVRIADILDYISDLLFVQRFVQSASSCRVFSFWLIVLQNSTNCPRTNAIIP